MRRICTMWMCVAGLVGCTASADRGAEPWPLIERREDEDGETFLGYPYTTLQTVVEVSRAGGDAYVGLFRRRCADETIRYYSTELEWGAPRRFTFTLEDRFYEALNVYSCADACEAGCTAGLPDGYASNLYMKFRRAEERWYVLTPQSDFRDDDNAGIYSFIMNGLLVYVQVKLNYKTEVMTLEVRRFACSGAPLDDEQEMDAMFNELELVLEDRRTGRLFVVAPLRLDQAPRVGGRIAAPIWNTCAGTLTVVEP